MEKYKSYTTCNFNGCNAAAFPEIKALMDHRKQAHGLKNHDHSDKLYACPDKGCWRRKKCKGFTTLLELEEHLRDKHGLGPQPIKDQASDGDPLHPITTNQLSMPDIPPNIDVNIANMNSRMGFTSPLPDSSILDSSGEEQQQQIPQVTNQEPHANAEEATRAPSHSEKESMKLRIKRLEIEKKRLDQEKIRRLNRLIWGRRERRAC